MMWRSVSCEVQGTGHKKNNLPCQDKTFSLEQDGVRVVALADGAGSASLSHYGADRLVRDASLYMAEHFYEYLACEDGRKAKRTLLEAFQKSLSEEALARGCEMCDLASTLLLAAVDGEHFLLVHIGDGVIGFLDGADLKVASMPDNGEFSNVTTFVTSPEALASMRLFKGELGQKNAFVLMSDGTEQSLYHKQSKTLAGVVVKLMHRTCLIDGETMRKQLEAAFASVISKNTQDDCSIAILARPSAFLRPLDMLAFEERQELYGVARSSQCAKKRADRCDEILAMTQTPCSLRQIAGRLHLKPEHAKKYVDRLADSGLLIQKGGFYQRLER